MLAPWRGILFLITSNRAAEKERAEENGARELQGSNYAGPHCKG